jgi:hypothetical protein
MNKIHKLMPTDKRHMAYLEAITQRDIATLHRKEATYGGSWKKRGGAGAFMVSFRKADRLENIAANYGYDIFKALAADMSGADGSALAELRDLRQYLMLIEGEALARLDDETLLPGPLPEQNRPGTPEDGGHHALYTPQLDDGVCNNQIENEDVDYYILTKQGNYIVDRNNTPAEFWEHLPRLPTSLKHTEFDKLDRMYDGLYECIHDTWVLKPENLKNWGNK